MVAAVRGRWRIVNQGRHRNTITQSLQLLHILSLITANYILQGKHYITCERVWLKSTSRLTNLTLTERDETMKWYLDG